MTKWKKGAWVQYKIWEIKLFIYLPIFSIYLSLHVFSLCIHIFYLYVHISIFSIYLSISSIYLSIFSIYLSIFSIYLPKFYIYLYFLSIYLPCIHIDEIHPKPSFGIHLKKYIKCLKFFRADICQRILEFASHIPFTFEL